MIVFINGTYGVGKTSVAEEMQRHITDIKTIIFDPDELYQNMAEEIFFDVINNRGGMAPQNNKMFLNRVKEKLLPYKDMNVLCIVPMALTTKETIEIVWESLNDNSKAIFHFILEADESIIEERINSDEGRKQKEKALGELQSNTIFLNNNFIEAIRINTNNKSVKEVANEIMNMINKVS